MGDKFEMLLEEVFGTEGFFPEDKLTSVIQRDADSEIDIDELDYVAAAQNDHYQQFLKYLENHDG